MGRSGQKVVTSGEKVGRGRRGSRMRREGDWGWGRRGEDMVRRRGIV